jgi:L-ascorbate metabolism protein UlaG (beta-lactamase superfamily)
MSKSTPNPAPSSPASRIGRLSLKLRFGKPRSPEDAAVAAAATDAAKSKGANGSGNRTGNNHVGLLPSRGWQQRNLQFINDILIPHFLAARLPSSPSSLLASLELNQTGVTWLGHAGFLIHIGGQNILVDPNWALWHGPVKRISHPSLTSRLLPYIDLVLITHAHFDHLHLPSLRAVAAGQPIIVPKGVGNVVKGCAFSSITELDYWKTTKVGDLKITFVPTKHWGARFIHDTYRQFGAYLIQYADQTIFHCGDSSMFDGFADIGKHADIDVAIMPIGAYRAPSGRAVHMNPEEAIEAADMMGANHLIPMHYGTFPLGGEPIQEPAIRLVESAARLGWQNRVQLLPEGQTTVFSR